MCFGIAATDGTGEAAVGDGLALGEGEGTAEGEGVTDIGESVGLSWAVPSLILRRTLAIVGLWSASITGIHVSRP